MIRKIIDFSKKETVFVAALLLAAFSAVLVPPSSAYFGYPDYRVLALLFSLMLIVAGVREQGVFRLLGAKLTGHVKNMRQLELVFLALCFFTSMLITNDVALITFVPFTLELLESLGQGRRMIRVVVLETIAANLGSMLTPIGNPQNLYLYSLTEMGLLEFLLLMLPLTAASLLLLLLAAMTGSREKLEVTQKKEAVRPDRKKLSGLLLLFVLCLGTVIHLIPWQVSFLAVCLAAGLWYRKLFGKVDYFLLGTFLGFFIFIGNMQQLPAVSGLLKEILKGRELLVAAGLSQVISNVPAAMLLSGFTGNYRALLYGVDVGGLGTLIASLASLISYKFYSSFGQESLQTDAHLAEAGKLQQGKGRYLKEFTLWNLAFLLVLLPLAYLLCR